MALIQLREQEAVITGVSREVIADIQKALRYRPTGYRYDPRYKYRRWDGYVRLFEDDTSFPVGLLHRVREILKKHSVQHAVEWVDEPTEGAPIAVHLNPEIEERWYQIEAAKEATAKRMGVIRAPTGSGKTVIAARIIHDIGKYGLIVVPTLDLLYQTAEFLTWALQTEIGIVGGGEIRPKQVTVGTTKSVSKILNLKYQAYEFDDGDGVEDFDLDITGQQKSLATWINKLGLLMFDECHVVGAATAYNIANALSVRHKYGMSASPWRDDNADLKIEAALGPIIYRVPTAILVQEGFLVPPVIQRLSTMPEDGIGQEFSSWNKAYASCITQNTYRNKLIANKVNTLVKEGHQVLVLVKMLKHGEQLRKLIDGAIFIAGSSPEKIQSYHTSEERTNTLHGLRNGSIRCVIATSIADMGIDVPSLSVLLLAGGGKSSTRHLQRIGRVCRPHPGKTCGLVIDLDDSWAHVKRSKSADGDVIEKPGWFANHVVLRRKIEKAEWGDVGYFI